MLHSISDLMCKAGQFDRANKIIELMAVDFMQEEARKLMFEEKKKQIAKI